MDPAHPLGDESQGAAGNAGKYGGPGKCPCPVCGGRTSRVKRRSIDHITSLFAPARRYRCDSFSCRWEGNQRLNLSTAASKGRNWRKRMPLTFVASMVFVAISMTLAIGVGLFELLPNLAHGISTMFGVGNSGAV